MRMETARVMLVTTMLITMEYQTRQTIVLLLRIQINQILKSMETTSEVTLATIAPCC